MRRNAGRKMMDDQSLVRSHRVAFNVTEGEWKDLQESVGSGSLSDFVRKIVLQRLRRKKKK